VNNLKDEFIKAIMLSLKIESNPFISATIDEFIAHIKPNEYKSFMTALFGSQHAYLNGIDRVAKVAETFKEVILEVDEVELKAKELIDLVHSMDYTIELKHAETSIDYNTLLNDVKFPTLSKDDEAILNNVKPYCSYKLLISNIRAYQTTKDALNAFIQAVKQSEKSGSLEISSDVRKMIKG